MAGTQSMSAFRTMEALSLTRQARQAWEKVLSLSKDPKRAELAKEHLGRIKEILR